MLQLEIATRRYGFLLKAFLRMRTGYWIIRGPVSNLHRLSFTGESILAMERVFWILNLKYCFELRDGFFFGLLFDSRSARPVKPTTAATVTRTALARLLRWMIKRGQKSFADLDNDVTWEFYESIVTETQKNHGEEINPGQLINNLKVLHMIYRQSDVLREHHVETMPESPYDGLSALAVSKLGAKAANGWIQPYPDVVVLPIWQSASRLLGAPADDVICLVHHCAWLTSIYKYSGKRPVTERRKSFALEFPFSVLKNESQPWINLEEDLPAGITKKPVSRFDFKVVGCLINISGAAVATLLGTTGMHVSELCAMEGGRDSMTDMPACIQTRISRTGLSELFYVQSKMLKNFDDEPLEWIIGSRPLGSNYVPPSVRAIDIMERLFAPWRTADCSSLFLNLCAPARNNLALTSDAVKPTSQLLRIWQKEFVLRAQCLDALPDQITGPGGKVDLRGYKSGLMIRTAPWRKTFAHHVVKVDPRLLPAISQHFKHLSIAMTEEGYVGNDPELQELMESARVHETVRFLLEQASDGAPLAGGMAAHIAQHRKELAELVARAGPPGVEALVLEHDLRIWFEPHGACLIQLSPGRSLCHKAAKTDPWFANAPNFAFRSPTMCAGCGCFAADKLTAPFWQARYDGNRALCETQKRVDGQPSLISTQRMRQAGAILRALEPHSSTA
ncbi:hypothetical protein ACSFBM_19195 [Variovorax sp. GB1R11]|uniref:hypothetical protein n=1 Tax=Variovorax sp. GB1R11 TaxID=3443741 RepID=UPI003F47CA58